MFVYLYILIYINPAGAQLVEGGGDRAQKLRAKLGAELDVSLC